MSRVLIVEDDLDVRDWIAHCMLQDGDEIRGVTDGRRLRALHADEPDYRPDLVLMDYALPDTDGVALLAELHGFWPDVPAVFVTVQWTGEIIERIARHRLRAHRQAVQPRRPARGRAPGAGDDGGARGEPGAPARPGSVRGVLRAGGLPRPAGGDPGQRARARLAGGRRRRRLAGRHRLAALGGRGRHRRLRPVVGRLRS